MLRIHQRIMLAIVLPAEDLLHKQAPCIDLSRCNVRLALRVSLVCALGGRLCAHHQMNSFLLVLECHAHAQHRDKGREPLVAALGGLEDLLQFVEDVGLDGALEAAEEVFQLPIGHAWGGEVVGVGVEAGIGMHALEGRVLAFFGDGEGMRHYECYDDEAEDFAEEFVLSMLVSQSILFDAVDAPHRRSWA